MNPSIPSDLSSSSPAAGRETATVAGAGYAPSVPISVYRELAAELKTTQAMVDALTIQNQQLAHQNQVLRQEFLRFAESADQLRQAVSATEAGLPLVATPMSPESEPAPSPPKGSVAEGVSKLAVRATRMMMAKAAPGTGMPAQSEPLFTEQPSEAFQTGSASLKKQDMSGLWLATTVLLIVISAFGAGFLIMRPLLIRSR